MHLLVSSWPQIESWKFMGDSKFYGETVSNLKCLEHGDLLKKSPGLESLMVLKSGGPEGRQCNCLVYTAFGYARMGRPRHCEQGRS